jgi:DinB family protein
MSITSIRPASSEYTPYHAEYVDAVPDGDILTILRANGQELDAMLASVAEERGGYRYAAGKWSIREIAGHIIDGERVLGYRALRAARNDTTPLPGYDAEAYIDPAGSNARSLADLRAELRAVRESTRCFYASLPDEAWDRVGVSGGRAITVRGLAYVIVGHAIHHMRVLVDRYGVEAPFTTRL